MRNVRAPIPDLDELNRVSRSFESAPPSAVIEWAVERFGSGLVLASSFRDCVLIDLATQVVPEVEVVFLDTQYHFAETLWYVDTVRRRYDLRLRIIEPDIEPDDRWLDDPDACCAARKVVPMAKALAGREAWMTGLRRDEAHTRANAPIVGYDVGRGMVKVNPIATWTDEDVRGYVADHDIIVNPLVLDGYTSIGCMPCTVKPTDPSDPRSGRWAGRDKTECGLHV